MSKKNKVILVTISLFVLLAVFIIISFSLKDKEENNYDVSMMNEVNVNDVLKMFDSKKNYVLYVGREGCNVCVHILPALKEAQIKNNYITQYLDIKKVDRSSDEWLELVDKLTMKSTQTLNETNKGEQVTETYGYFLHNYGFTPTIIVIKNGKQTAGFIGNATQEELVNWLSSKVN